MAGIEDKGFIGAMLSNDIIRDTLSCKSLTSNHEEMGLGGLGKTKRHRKYVKRKEEEINLEIRVSSSMKLWTSRIQPLWVNS
jgi:hypothetical protein